MGKSQMLINSVWYVGPSNSKKIWLKNQKRESTVKQIHGLRSNTGIHKHLRLWKKKKTSYIILRPILITNPRFGMIQYLPRPYKMIIDKLNEIKLILRLPIERTIIMIRILAIIPTYPNQTSTLFGSIGDLYWNKIGTKYGRNSIPPINELNPKIITNTQGNHVLRRNSSRSRSVIFGCKWLHSVPFFSHS